MSVIIFGDIEDTTIVATPPSGRKTDTGDGQERNRAWVDDEGRVILPPVLAKRFGLQPGTEILIEEDGSSLRLRRPVTHLTKVYVEPTNACNLNCRMCIRNIWNEPLGHMSAATYQRILDGIKHFPQPLSVSFSGFGEPLGHPEIVSMVQQAKACGTRVELITNATLLDRKMSQQLIDAGLDVLWISLDGATPESYADVRLAQALPTILKNIQQFHQLRLNAPHSPELGIAFVAMKRNIADLPAIIRLGNRFGVSRYSISGVLPHTAEMACEALYTRTLGESVARSSRWVPIVDLPRLDINEDTQEALYRVIRSGRKIIAGEMTLGEKTNRCPFIEDGTVSIGWQGDVSPCLALLHEDVSYLSNRPRRALRYIVGNVNERTLYDIWMDPSYVSFRQRVQRFEFAPCTYCGGCTLSETNEEDCFGNTFPTCGGCLWAQGVIQCP